MLIFLYGEDSYRSRQKLNEIVGRYKKIHKSGLNLDYLDDQNLVFQDFKQKFETVSMFDEKKLFILESVLSNKNFKEEFFKQKEGFLKSDNIVLFYEKGAGTQNDPLLKFLKKNSNSQEFEPLGGNKLKTWVKKEFEKRDIKIKIGDKSLDKLIEFVGNDLWRMDNEIKKLADYRSDSQKVGILENDIEVRVKRKIESGVFKTIDALAENKKALALDLIHKHLEKGDAPLYLLTMINFQFRNLLEIKDLIEKYVPYYDILKQSSLHPFIVKKSYQQAQRFTFQQLKKIYQKIFEVDLGIKTGKIEPETALDLLIAGI